MRGEGTTLFSEMGDIPYIVKREAFRVTFDRDFNLTCECR